MAKFFLVIGILAMGLSGACSINVLFFMGRFEWGVVPIVMLVGGIPFAIGLIVFLYSRKAIRNNAAEPQDKSDQKDN